MAGTDSVQIGIGKSGASGVRLRRHPIVPSRRTRDPEDVSIAWEIDAYRFELPLVASAMDGVVSPETAIRIGQLGGLGRAQPRGPVDALRRPRAAARRRSPQLPEEPAPPRGCRRSTPSRSSPT